MVHEVEDSVSSARRSTGRKAGLSAAARITAAVWTLAVLVLSVACADEEKNLAPAVNNADSLPFMQSKGISTLISDSGIMRYKITAEEWDIYNHTNPPKWVFIKGLLLEKFDSTFHIDWFVQSDTAYCHNQQLWELRGRVVVRNQQGTVFTSEELFWDMDRHEMYSHLFMRIRTPERMIQGYNFRSNEQMTIYKIESSQGEAPFNDRGADEPTDTVARTAPAKPQ